MINKIELRRGFQLQDDQPVFDERNPTLSRSCMRRRSSDKATLFKKRRGPERQGGREISPLKYDSAK